MNNFAHLVPDSPFYPIFKDGMAPIKNPLAPCEGQMGEQGEHGVHEFYWLDVSRLDVVQMVAIAAFVAQQCGGEPGEVLDHMKQEKQIPLRALHVASVSMDLRAFI